MNDCRVAQQSLAHGPTACAHPGAAGGLQNWGGTLWLGAEGHRAWVWGAACGVELLVIPSCAEELPSSTTAASQWPAINIPLKRQHEPRDVPALSSPGIFPGCLLRQQLRPCWPGQTRPWLQARAQHRPTHPTGTLCSVLCPTVVSCIHLALTTPEGHVPGEICPSQAMSSRVCCPEPWQGFQLNPC